MPTTVHRADKDWSCPKCSLTIKAGEMYGWLRTRTRKRARYHLECKRKLMYGRGYDRADH